MIVNKVQNFIFFFIYCLKFKVNILVVLNVNIEQLYNIFDILD